jgi:hypothetical protein
MKISRVYLRRLIKEELENPKIVELLSKILDAVSGLDISIDYLSATITGQDPLSLGQMQKGIGRYYRPPARDIKRDEIKENDA